MFVGYGRRAYAQCAGPAPTLTCTGTIAGNSAPGVVNGGIVVPGGYDTLNVNNLAGDITPGAGQDGINFVSAGDITITSDTGAYAISVAGFDADGILAQSTIGAVTVDSTGDITSVGSRGIAAFNTSSGAADVEVMSAGTIQAASYGIFARSSTGGVTVGSVGDILSGSVGILAFNNLGAGDVEVTSAGTIQAVSTGIQATSDGGAVTVGSTGDITSDSARGIYARSFGTAVEIVSAGNLQAASGGIFARSYTGAVTVGSTGDITSDSGQGILAFNYGVGAGDVEVTSAGTIQAAFEGIFAQSSTGAVTVGSTGDITSDSSRGITTLRFGVGTGDVQVTSAGTIQARYQGIYARSNTGAVTLGSTGDITSTYSTGIYARSYGLGAGDVEVTSAGTIQAASDGILARSSTGAVTVGSTGDITSDGDRGIYALNSGAGAGDVEVTSAGTIQANADGIFARSSTGAVTVGSTGDITSDDSRGIYAINFGLGAGNVEVTSTGTIQALSHGIYARSGTGAVIVDSTGDITSDGNRGIFAFNSGVGAGDVEVTNAGTIQANSEGVYARSSTGAVTVDSTGDVTSDGNRGIQAFNSGVGAGDVEVISAGTIQANFDGIRARSSTGAVTVGSTGDITSTNSRGIVAANYYLGGGDVEVTSAGTIQAASFGIYARSYAGAVTVGSTGDISSDNRMGILALNQGQGAGDVVVTSSGTIQAFYSGIIAGSYSGAVAVSSIGDITSDSSDGIYARNSGAAAGDVSVTSAGTIQAASYGIFARSSTGAVTVGSTGDVTSNGSGIVALTIGAGAGDVEVTSAGTIQATSEGIYAASSTGAVTVGSTGDITSNIASGIATYSGVSADVTISSGLVTGALSGVEFIAGLANTLTNVGTLSGGNFAVSGTTGNETVYNDGVVIGNVDLGSGSNSFDNRLSGTFAAGASVNLGAGNLLTNSGNLTPGGVGTVQTTALTGSLVQTSDGVFTIDLDEGGASDLVTIAGTADFAGTVNVNILNISNPSGSVVIADATGPVSNTAVATDTSQYDFFLTTGDGTQLVLMWQPASLINLIDGPLTPNQLATAQYIDAINQAGPSPGLLALINAVKGRPNEAAILAALDRLHPEHYLAQVEDTLQSSWFFLNSVMSCPTAEGANIEGQCFWAKIGGRDFDWDRTTTNIGGDGHAWNVSGGVQIALDGTWRLGAALSYEDTQLSTNNAARSDGDRIEGAVVIKNRWGNLSAALAGFGGYGWYDTDRTIALAGIDEASGEHEIRFAGVHMRLSHLFQAGSIDIRPMIDLNATYLDYGGLTESGGGAANLAIGGESDWVLSASPALEVSTKWHSGGHLLRPYLRAGVTFYNDRDYALTSTFVAAPDGVAPFTIGSHFDETLLDLGVGLDVITAGGISLKLNYDGRFGEDTDIHSGGAKASFRF